MHEVCDNILQIYVQTFNSTKCRVKAVTVMQTVPYFHPHLSAPSCFSTLTVRVPLYDGSSLRREEEIQRSGRGTL